MQVTHDELNMDSVAQSKISGQLLELTSDERTRLREILSRLIALDENLADIHLCLPTVEIAFYLFDETPIRSVRVSPLALLGFIDSLQDFAGRNPVSESTDGD